MSSQTNIYRLGAASCLILLLYSLATLLIMTFIGGPPGTIEETFSILHSGKVSGLLRLDILTVFVMPLYYLLFYVLFVALKNSDHAGSAISMMLVFAGVTLFLATPSVFSYLYLSDKFAVVTSDFEKTQLLAAGKSIVASDMWHGTGARIGGLLLQSGALLISILMLRSDVFNKSTAIVGISTHGLDLVHIIIGFFIPVAGDTIMFIAGPLYLLWFPMVGLRLWKLRNSRIIQNTELV
ncbi:MAG: hypothetical protein ACM3RX_06080 [Methanococcaceae archaeon]